MGNETKARQKADPVWKQYAALVRKWTPKSKLGQGCLRAFWVGGVICMLGQAVADISAALRCAPAPQMQEAGAPGQTQRGGSHRETACPQAGLSPARTVCCDANGNILSAQSYLRTVYRAFALSDGFA